MAFKIDRCRSIANALKSHSNIREDQMYYGLIENDIRANPKPIPDILCSHLIDSDIRPQPNPNPNVSCSFRQPTFFLTLTLTLKDGGGEIERHEFHNVMKRGGWGRPRKLPWERARGKPPPTEDLEQPAETTKPTKGLGERDQENVLRVLVASLERGFKEGRSLYGRKIRSLAEAQP